MKFPLSVPIPVWTPSCEGFKCTALCDTQNIQSSQSKMGEKMFFFSIKHLARKAHVEPGRHSQLSPESPNGLVLISLWKTMRLKHICFDLQFTRLFCVVSYCFCCCCLFLLTNKSERGPLNNMVVGRESDSLHESSL